MNKRYFYNYWWLKDEPDNRVIFWLFSNNVVMQYQKINNIVFRALKVLIALLTLAMDLLISMVKFLAAAAMILWLLVSSVSIVFSVYSTNNEGLPIHLTVHLVKATTVFLLLFELFYFSVISMAYGAFGFSSKHKKGFAKGTLGLVHSLLMFKP